jgi:hypothetical protein
MKVEFKDREFSKRVGTILDDATYIYLSKRKSLLKIATVKFDKKEIDINIVGESILNNSDGTPIISPENYKDIIENGDLSKDVNFDSVAYITAEDGENYYGNYNSVFETIEAIKKVKSGESIY